MEFAEAVVLESFGSDVLEDWVRTDVEAACFFCADCLVTYHEAQIRGSYSASILDVLGAEARSLGGIPRPVHTIPGPSQGSGPDPPVRRSLNVEIPDAESARHFVKFKMDETSLSVLVWTGCFLPTEYADSRASSSPPRASATRDNRE